jgi:hypothetical protein
MGAVELAGQRSQTLERDGVLVEIPGRAEPLLDGGPVAFGQVVEHVTFLVADTALHRRVYAEHVAERLAQCLRAVEDAEHALLDFEPAVDDVGEQRGGDGGVLARALPEPKRASPRPW